MRCDSAPRVLENPSCLYAKYIVLEIINNQTVKLKEIAEPGKELSPAAAAAGTAATVCGWMLLYF